MRCACWAAILTTLILGGCSSMSSAPPDDQVAIDHFVAAQLLLDEGETDAALAELDLAVADDPDLAVAHAAIGGIRWSQEQFEAAAEAYGEAVRANPFDMDLQEQLAACYDRLGQSEKAEAIRNGGATTAMNPRPL
jgi:Tfp pilus assembly protein PilF